jgi:drug/metabolite transporter (DMT)-like permease
MRIVVALTVAILANSFGNFCLSKGMKQYGSGEDIGFHWLMSTGSHVVTNPWLITGVVLLLVFLSAYLTALSWADLSFVLPATAPAYLINAALSKYYLHETISPLRWGGTIMIVLGTFLVARSYKETASTATATASAEMPN